MKISIALLLPLATSGFIFPQPMKIKDGLVHATDSLEETTPLSINLDIGSEEKGGQSSRMSISGIIMELSSQLANYQHPKMPGSDGPNPELSAGVRTLNLIQPGSFVSMAGKKIVETLNGCWEMVWKDNSNAGSLICGFDIPDEYRRNDASLPKGRVYLSFPVWTKEGLKKAQEEKAFVVNLAKEMAEEKNKEMTKYHETSNPFKKALHYRNAVATLEKMSFHKSLKSFDMVPSNEEIVKLHDDLLLNLKGMVFTKDQIKHKFDQVMLGTAMAQPVAQPLTP